jgi:hypothetical protein
VACCRVNFTFTSQIIFCFPITETSGLILLRKSVTACSENHLEHIFCVKQYLILSNASTVLYVAKIPNVKFLVDFPLLVCLQQIRPICLNGICGLLGYYVALCGNYLPTFRDKVSVPSSRVKSPRWKESQPIT